MYTVMSDVQMSRRKRMVFILDENDTVVFSSAKFASALEWLYENGHTKCAVQGENDSLRFDIGFVKS